MTRTGFLFAAYLMIGLGLMPLSARGDDSLQDSSGPKEIGYNATLTLTVDAELIHGACNIGYSSTCGTGDCNCRMATGNGSGSVFGTASNVTLALTADLGETTVGNSCFPVYGNLSISGSKDSETIDLSATVCNTLDGTLQLTGGFQFRELSSKGLTATGTVTISAPTTNPSKFQMKLKGKAVMSLVPPP